MPVNRAFAETLKETAHVTGRMDQYEFFMQGKRLSKVARNFGEIVTADDLKTRCLDYGKGCAIALLPAMTISEYEDENHKQQITTLEALDEQAKRMPIHYSWVNVTCHPEWLQHFQVDAF